MNVETAIREKLAALTPESLEIRDESSAHIGHAGAADGGGHYQLRIVATCFSGLPTLARHRLVYAALGPMMHKEIHALSIQAYAPQEI